MLAPLSKSSGESFFKTASNGLVPPKVLSLKLKGNGHGTHVFVSPFHPGIVVKMWIRGDGKEAQNELACLRQWAHVKQDESEHDTSMYVQHLLSMQHYSMSSSRVLLYLGTERYDRTLLDECNAKRQRSNRVQSDVQQEVLDHLWVMLQVFLALECCHTRRKKHQVMIHRQLWPDHVMLGKVEENSKQPSPPYRAVLGGFSRAALFPEEMHRTQPLRLAGPIPYEIETRAPEMSEAMVHHESTSGGGLSTEYTPATDVWAAGTMSAILLLAIPDFASSSYSLKDANVLFPAQERRRARNGHEEFFPCRQAMEEWCMACCAQPSSFSTRKMRHALLENEECSAAEERVAFLRKLVAGAVVDERRWNKWLSGVMQMDPAKRSTATESVSDLCTVLHNWLETDPHVHYPFAAQRYGEDTLRHVIDRG